MCMETVYACPLTGFHRLCGYPPFHGSTVMRMFREIRTAHYDFNPEYWSKISDDAKDFIVHLLKTAPSERMTAHQALKHRWYVSDKLNIGTERNM